MPGPTQLHWERVYSTRPATQVSWHQSEPVLSLDMIAAAGTGPAGAVVDIGGGASRLVDRLLERGFLDVSVLDVSTQALGAARARIGERAAIVDWLVEDVTAWKPARPFDVWHDRAVFHFLAEEADRHAYVRALNQALPVAGHAVLATFALTGPDRCSGLAVQRYSAESLSAALGSNLQLLRTTNETHMTPGGAPQDFIWCLFRKTADEPEGERS